MKINIDATSFFMVFMILKLCNVINWSWWLVTFPLWGFILSWFVIKVIITWREHD